MKLRTVALRHLAPRRSPRLGQQGLKAPNVQSPRWAAPRATYIICTNPRSGSWLLSEGLASTLLAGNPREWLNTKEEHRHRARWRMNNSNDLSCEAYLALARGCSTSSNGISGIKLHYYQFAQLPEKLGAVPSFQGLTPAQIMARLFPGAKYIWLTRRDKRRQAISYMIASQTDIWWNIESTTPGGAEGAADKPAFDPLLIARRERAFVENDAGWQDFFDANGIQPLVIAYEDIVGDLDGTIRAVLTWLGVENASSVRVPPPRLKPQSNSLNEDWLARYSAFQAAGGDAQPGPTKPPSDFRQRSQVHSAWQEWIGRSRLLGMDDETIVQVLCRNGYTLATATAEAGKAAADAYLRGAIRTNRRLNKAATLLTIQSQLARLSTHAVAIERRKNVSRDEFLSTYYAANRPVILQGLMGGWKAMETWNPEALKARVGDVIVEVMRGRDADAYHEVNTRKHRANMRFGDYIDMVYSGKITNDYYLVANNEFFALPGMRQLLDDIVPFPEYLTSAAPGRQCFLWFGPAGTVTPLHHDTSNILLAQVAGRKVFRIIPASQWSFIYNTHGVFSEVDCEKPDLQRHPKYRDATPIEVVLEPGDALFVPVGWWHHVRALEPSLTVSFTNFVFPNHFGWE